MQLIAIVTKQLCRLQFVAASQHPARLRSRKIEPLSMVEKVQQPQRSSSRHM